MHSRKKEQLEENVVDCSLLVYRDKELVKKALKIGKRA